MSKECQSCIKEGIGCESVQKMMREIDELKKAKAHRILMWTAFFIISGFIIISFIVWNYMLRQPITVRQMPESQLKDLSELFNAQFTNLLTVMGGLITIFGFILPLINLYYQRQTLKEERESIKREVDRSLEIIKEQVKKFDFNLQQAKEERKVEINKVRSELAKAIEDAKKAFKTRQDTIDKTLAEHEKNRHWDSGYFMQQLAIADQEFFGKVIYYCNALPYFSKYCDDSNFQERIYDILNDLPDSINKMQSEYLLIDDCLSHVYKQLDAAKKDLAKNYPLSTKIDEIKDLINKRKDEVIASAKKTSVATQDTANPK